ncbi:MAG: bifunctional riboflavin kinase/FAD synthetase [Candidatus Cloacimonadaceae bacterium]|jgi:riboflavin kinase/FMN adenylyltransferase
MKSIVSMGNFDGLHLGHRKLIKTMVDLAKEQSLKSVIITFKEHPALVLNKPHNFQLLIPCEHKIQMIKDLGVDEIKCLPFTRELSQLSALDFLKTYIIEELDPAIIVVGYDSHFGHRREGNYQFLQKHAQGFGYQCLYVPALEDEEGVISSSRIRALLQEGRIDEANRLLGSPYSMYGEVVRGKGLGKGMGFPTANLALDDAQQLIPRAGVYISRVFLAEDVFFGLTNIGTAPSVKQDRKTTVETYMPEYNADLYGARMKLELLHFMRPELCFASRAELIQAMQADLAKAKTLFEEYA